MPLSSSDKLLCHLQTHLHVCCMLLLRDQVDVHAHLEHFQLLYLHERHGGLHIHCLKAPLEVMWFHPTHFSLVISGAKESQLHSFAVYWEGRNLGVNTSMPAPWPQRKGS